MNKKDIWALIGKLSLVIGTIWGLIQVYEYIKSGQAKIEASVLTSQYPIPNEVLQSHQYFDSRNVAYEIKDTLGLDSLDMPFFVTSRLREVLSNRMEETFNFGFFRYSGKKLITVNVENTSEQVVTNTNIKIDNCSGFYQYQDQEENYHFGEFTNTFELGGLRPSDKMAVYIWSSGLCGEVLINYDSGVVYPERRVITSGIYAWLAYHDVLMYVVIFAGSFFIFVILPNLSKKTTDKEEGEESAS